MKHALIHLCFLLAIPFIASGCAQLLQTDNALFLEDLAAGDSVSRIKERTPTPTVQKVEYENSKRQYQADLYQPRETALAGIVLIPGVAQNGREDPRLVMFANTLARFRFVVLVPEIPNLRDLKIRAEDSQTIKDAFEYLVSQNDLSPQAKIGMGAFSYAVGPAILAALDPAISDKVGFILGVGGYYDIEKTITYFTTGQFRYQNEWHYLEPNEYGKWVFVLSNLERLTDPIDQMNFREIAWRKMNNPNAIIDDLTVDLSPEAFTILMLLENQDPELAPEHILSLPAPIRTDISSLDLSSKDLNHLKARLILLHGTDDNIIPYTESIALANAVAEDQAELYLIDGLAHVDIHPQKLDKWVMLSAVSALLEMREM